MVSGFWTASSQVPCQPATVKVPNSSNHRLLPSRAKSCRHMARRMIATMGKQRLAPANEGWPEPVTPNASGALKGLAAGTGEFLLGTIDQDEGTAADTTLVWVDATLTNPYGSGT